MPPPHKHCTHINWRPIGMSGAGALPAPPNQVRSSEVNRKLLALIERESAGQAQRLFASGLLPSPDRHIDVPRIKLDRSTSPVGLLGRHQGGSRAGESIKDDPVLRRPPRSARFGQRSPAVLSQAEAAAAPETFLQCSDSPRNFRKLTASSKSLTSRSGCPDGGQSKVTPRTPPPLRCAGRPRRAADPARPGARTEQAAPDIHQ